MKPVTSVAKGRKATVPPFVQNQKIPAGKGEKILLEENVAYSSVKPLNETASPPCSSCVSVVNVMYETVPVDGHKE